MRCLLPRGTQNNTPDSDELSYFITKLLHQTLRTTANAV